MAVKRKSTAIFDMVVGGSDRYICSLYLCLGDTCDLIWGASRYVCFSEIRVMSRENVRRSLDKINLFVGIPSIPLVRTLLKCLRRKYETFKEVR